MQPAKHEPIISLATFNAVRERLSGNAKVPARKDIHEDFPLRGFVECDDCGSPLTSCWAKGRSERYPYYHCQTKGCRSYGKSIKRDVLESGFRDILNTVTPSVELLGVATAIFHDLWEAASASSKNAQAHLMTEALRLERQIEQLVDRIVNAESETLIGAYENRLRALEAEKVEMKEKIANCGRPLNDFDTTYRTAMEFLGNPAKRWDFGDLSEKRAVLKLTFESRIRYHREEGFRTAETTVPFNIFNCLCGSDSDESEMVHPTGFEPVAPRLGI
ncbi:MAG: zinc ribbon domain-containing protein [Sphingorhabdus sp.]|nr:zinc ribbon domain-containing protein [Sphingorhabdus sp.]